MTGTQISRARKGEISGEVLAVGRKKGVNPERLAERVAQGTVVIGCGVGAIAIMAARRGADKVYAVDIREEACDLARRNVARNDVADKVTVLQGDLFEPLETMKIGVIIDDVSGMAEEALRISGWYPARIPTGALDGMEPMQRMLREAPKHLAKRVACSISRFSVWPTRGGCLHVPRKSSAIGCRRRSAE